MAVMFGVLFWGGQLSVSVRCDHSEGLLSRERSLLSGGTKYV